MAGRNRGVDVAAVQADPSVGLGEGAIDNSPKLDAAWFAVHVAAVCRGLWRARSMHHWTEEAALSVERCGQRKSLQEDGRFGDFIFPGWQLALCSSVFLPQNKIPIKY